MITARCPSVTLGTSLVAVNNGRFFFVVGAVVTLIVVASVVVCSFLGDARCNEKLIKTDKSLLKLLSYLNK